jgi:hypothetical protein
MFIKVNVKNTNLVIENFLTEADNDFIVGPTCSATSPVSNKKSSHRQSGIDPPWKRLLLGFYRQIII